MSALISASQSVQPGTSTALRDHGYGLVYHAMCLYTTYHVTLQGHRTELNKKDRSADSR